MVLIINYWGGKKGMLKLKAKPELISHIVNGE